MGDFFISGPSREVPTPADRYRQNSGRTPTTTCGFDLFRRQSRAADGKNCRVINGRPQTDDDDPPKTDNSLLALFSHDILFLFGTNFILSFLSLSLFLCRSLSLSLSVGLSLSLSLVSGPPSFSGVFQSVVRVSRFFCLVFSEGSSGGKGSGEALFLLR